MDEEAESGKTTARLLMSIKAEHCACMAVRTSTTAASTRRSGRVYPARVDDGLVGDPSGTALDGPKMCLHRSDALFAALLTISKSSVLVASNEHGSAAVLLFFPING